LASSQIMTYRRKLEDFIKDGTLVSYVGHDSFIEQLQQTGMRSGDRIRLKNDFDLAMVMGFGFIDSTIQSGETYEYGLFGVYAGGRESSEPLDTYITMYVDDEEEEQLKVELNAEQSGSNVELSWISDRSVHDQAGLLTYNIYRKKNKDDEWERIVPPFISPRDKTDDALVWKFTDKDVDAYRSWYYAVAPLNKFQVEFGKSWVKYEPKEWAPAQISKLEVPDNRRIEIFWEIDQEMELHVQGFRVERRVEGEDEFTQLDSALLEKGTLLPGGKRYLQDRSPVPRKMISYRIVTINMQGTEFESEAQSVYFKGPPVPDAPETINLQFSHIDGKGYVTGTWDMSSLSNTVAQYRLFNDMNLDRKLMENGSSHVGLTNSYTWEIVNKPGNVEYTFGIQPVDKKSKRGKRVISSIFVPRLKAPSVRNVQVEMTPDAAALVSWKYPHCEDLLGFRVYIDGELVSDENTVPANARAWQIYDYPDRYDESYTLNFEVEAVFAHCTHRAQANPLLSMNRTRPDRSLRAPRSKAWIVGAMNGTRWVSLEWDEYLDPPHDPEIYGYLLQAGNDPEFVKSKTVRVTKCDQYFFEIPEGWDGDKIFFRCSAQGSHFWGGLPSVSTVGKHPNYWKDKDVGPEKVKRMKEHNRTVLWRKYMNVLRTD